MLFSNFLNGFLNALHRDSTKLTMTPEEAQQFLQAFDMKMSYSHDI